MDDSETDVLGYMTFTSQHRPKLHSTNPLERLNGEVECRTEVIGIFPNEALSPASSDRAALGGRKIVSSCPSHRATTSRLTLRCSEASLEKPRRRLRPSCKVAGQAKHLHRSLLTLGVATSALDTSTPQSTVSHLL